VRAGPPPLERAAQGQRRVGRECFPALAALGDPAAARWLVGQLASAADVEAQTRAALQPAGEAEVRALAQRLQARLAGRAQAARRMLTALAGQDLGPDPRAWVPWLAAQPEPQLLPAGE